VVSKQGWQRGVMGAARAAGGPPSDTGFMTPERLDPTRVRRSSEQMRSVSGLDQCSQFREIGTGEASLIRFSRQSVETPAFSAWCRAVAPARASRSTSARILVIPSTVFDQLVQGK